MLVPFKSCHIGEKMVLLVPIAVYQQLQVDVDKRNKMYTIDVSFV